MKIAFFSNYLNHHQIPFAEAMNSLKGVDFTFVAVSGVPEFRIKLGYLEYDKPYLMDLTKDPSNREKALQLSVDADVAIFVSSGAEHYLIPRLKEKKMTFICSERWLKRKFNLNLLSPRLWYHMMVYWKYGRWNNNLYVLCASAYAANDYYALHAYRDRCYKWAYFTKVDEDFEVEAPKQGASTSEITPLMWCARFLKLKHPELPVQLAANLKAKGYHFVIDMFGNGEEFEKTKKLISDLGVEDCVRLCGNHPNAEILQEMRKHSIFLFTSDKNEGWGAVLNEAMSNGCVPIACKEIGSAPYLIKDGENGMLFNSRDIVSLEKAVCSLLDNPQRINEMSNMALRTMRVEWSPRNAASRFFNLIKHLGNGQETPYKSGPCSKASPIKI